MPKIVEAFNRDPDRGIEILINNDIQRRKYKILLFSYFVIENADPENLANFLINTECIDEKMLGNFLGSGKDRNKLIL